MAESPVTGRDVVCDLGAGLGALTAPLAATGARVIAVELHPARAAALRTRWAGTRVAVVELDVRQFTLPGRPYRVVANPPYDGINGLLRRLLADRHLLSADLVLAEGTARGLAARHRRVVLGPRLPQRAFVHPPPFPARVVTWGSGDRRGPQANGSGVAPGSLASSSRASAATLCSTSTS